MPLASQRFRGVTTLERCVSEGYRLTVDDPDTVAVTRLQHAMQDLGYLGPGAGDGFFGRTTGKAVSAFKTDHALQPTDPVVSTGTMTALDAVFAWEPVDPDAPDPSTDGLLEVGETARALAHTWSSAGLDALRQYSEPDANDVSPGRQTFEAALLRNFGAMGDQERDTLLRHFVFPMVDAMTSVLDGPIAITALDRAQYAQLTGPTYDPVAGLAGMIVAITPPFRNAWDHSTRTHALLNAAARYAYPHAWHWGWPSSPRYAGLGVQQRHNTVAYATFAAEIATATVSTARPAPAWYPI